MVDFAEFACETVLGALQKHKTLKLYEDKGFHWSSSKICKDILNIDGTIVGGNGSYGHDEMIKFFVGVLSRISLLHRIASLRNIGGKEERSIKDVADELETNLTDIPSKFRDVDFAKVFTSGEHYWREHW